LFGPRGEPYSHLDLPKGILLGVEVDFDYELGMGRMRQGDILVLFTDGITEASSPAGDFYTQERLVAHLNRLRRPNATELIKEIVDEVKAFSSGVLPQSDDIIVVVLRYT
jgi:sigma-B regulation protein RsbU (phosphoserine phosphatase)